MLDFDAAPQNRMRHVASFILPLLLVCPTAAQRMITCDSSLGVYEIDITTGARTQIGTLSSNVGIAAGLAYDAVAGKLYVTSTGNDSVYLVDVTNWNATLIGNYGLGTLPLVHGLEWDSSTDTLYAMSMRNSGLYTVDTTTGLATLVGVTGLSGLVGICSLAHDTVQNVMYMTTSGAASCYTIDRATGAATLRGPLGAGANTPTALAYNVDNQTMYLLDNLARKLFTIHPVTGAATLVGPTGVGNLLGLAYLPGNGRLARSVHGCGNTTITVTGNAGTGSALETVVGNTTGVPLVGYGLTALGVPFCNCTIGHEWSFVTVGSPTVLQLPANPGLVGLQLFVQGADLFGAGGCADPLLTTTDTITVTIG